MRLPKAKAKEAAADAEDQQEATEFKNAAKECAAERGDTDETRTAFSEKYGTNANKRTRSASASRQKAAGDTRRRRRRPSRDL